MTSAVRVVSPEVVRSTPGDSACPTCPVCPPSNRASADVAARLVQLAEGLARVTADVVTLLHTPPAPVVVQAETTGRSAWSVSEFAAAFGLAKSTVYRLIDKGEIRHGRVNGSIRISEEERLRWWAEREQRTADELGVA